MNKSTKALALAVGGAFALSIAATTVNAASNPFTAKSLSSGYMVAEADMKMKDGKCNTGKCSANKKKSEAMEGKAMEKSADGSCSADKKMPVGSCHGDTAKSETAK